MLLCWYLRERLKFHNGGEKVIETQPGTNLLSALMEEDIYLSKCLGGGGSRPCVNARFSKVVEMANRRKVSSGVALRRRSK